MSEEYEGKRLKKMRMALDKALDKTINSFTEKTMSDCFPLIAKENSDLLVSLHSNLTTQIRQIVKVIKIRWEFSILGRIRKDIKRA